MKENRHSILINADAVRVLPEVVLWGEAAWWPKGSLMRFSRKEKGPVAVGTRYRQEVLLPFAPSWDVEVEALDSSRITRRFLNGMLEGSHETVSCSSRESGVEVVYAMTYSVKGSVDRVLWTLIFQRLHDANIEAILSSLKNFLEGGLP